MLNRTDVVYVYDGSFEGYMTSVFDAFERKEMIRLITSGDFQPGFDEQVRYIETDEKKSDRVITGMCKKLTKEAYEKVYIAFLSELSGWEITALSWLRLAFKTGPQVFNMTHDSRVIAMNDYSKKVGHEQERLTGFLRFSEMSNGIYYAEITPTYNVTALLMPHFSNRFNSQPFIIYDKRRKIAGVYDTKSWYMTEANEINLPDVSDKETDWQKLWCTFYDTIAIKERVSEQRRMRVMPKKYWPNMLEMKNEALSKGVLNDSEDKIIEETNIHKAPLALSDYSSSVNTEE